MRILVVGNGVIGLTTAHVLASHGHETTIVARRSHHATVSNRACAVWLPVFMGSNTTEEHEAMYQEWASDTFEILRMRTPADGVLSMPLYRLGAESNPPPPVDAEAVNLSRVDIKSVPASIAHAWKLNSYAIDMPVYLSTLDREAQALGVRSHIGRAFTDMDDLLSSAQGYDVVVNCTGGGSRELARDRSVSGVKGVLVFGLPRPAALTGILSHESFVLAPRLDTLALGALYMEVFTSEQVEVSEVNELLERHRAWPDAVLELVGLRRRDLDDWHAVHAVAGLRPVREGGPRAAVENLHGQTVIHNYGHGGAGVTLSWGCAEWVARQLEGLPNA